MKQTMILGTLKTTFGAAAIAAATVLALGSTTSPAYADGGGTVSAVGGPCEVNKECTVVVLVKAGDGVHVNTDYNHKVTVSGPSTVTFLGKSTATLFSKTDGDHEFPDEKTGKIKVRFKASAKGKVTIAGTYKFATCKEGTGGGCTPGSGSFSADVNIK